MTLPSGQTRTYERSKSVVFFKTKEAFGGLSNMASGFPLRVNGVRILTSEALYQACRFPHMPDVQRKIIAEHSPMTAKMKGKPYRDQSRPDWDAVRTKIMRWCLRVKLAQNFNTFGDLLLATGDRPIVEQSRKDDFWGAKQAKDGTLVGMNVLGRLLMELREELKSSPDNEMKAVRSLPIPDFLLYGYAIESIGEDKTPGTPQTVVPVVPPSTIPPGFAEQSSFFHALEPHQRSTVFVGRNGIKAGTLASLNPYRSYQTSVPEWVGAIPDHWSLLPNRALFAEVKERNRPEADLLSVTITRGVLLQTTLLAGGSKKDSSKIDKSVYKHVSPGDLAYNKMRAWQGAIGVSQFSGIVSPAYVVMRLRTVQHRPRYFHYLYSTPHFAKEAERWSYGITSDMWSLRPEHFKLICSPLPPPDEQLLVVRFLDHATRQIDKTIHEKRRVVALLNEQKRAIIDRAVTRGLREDAPLKQSGTTWIRNIPRHWSMSRLKFEASHIVDCLHATPRYSPDGDFPAIRTADIEPGRVRLYQARKLSLEEFKRWTIRLMPREGDILYSREGERYGIAALVPKDTKLCISQRMMVFRIKEGQCSEYIMWQLNCPHVYAQASADIIGSTSPHVNIEQIKNFQLAIPPLGEQQEIVSEIRERTKDIDTVVSRTEREISFLREYRTRLVADIVTGKLDVRKAAADLPNEDYAQDEPIATDEEQETDLEESTAAGAVHG
jgi:type I restriction enzyme S subunit